MNPPPAMTVVLDPSVEVFDTLSSIDEWLSFGDYDDVEDEAVVRRAARAAGALYSLLGNAARTAPDLYSPDGHFRLAPMTAVTADLRAITADIHRAIHSMLNGQPPSGTFRVLGLLDRCALCSPTEDGALLAAAARSGPGALRLDAHQYRAYQRFARLVLLDPLDRFIAVAFPPSIDLGDLSQPSLDSPEVGP